MIKYKDLFNYLQKSCNFHTAKGDIAWTCDGKLTNTEKFCKDYWLDFVRVRERLQRHGGFCDCEVLLNAMERINGNESVERLITHPKSWNRFG